MGGAVKPDYPITRSADSSRCEMGITQTHSSQPVRGSIKGLLKGQSNQILVQKQPFQTFHIDSL